MIGSWLAPVDDDIQVVHSTGASSLLSVLLSQERNKSSWIFQPSRRQAGMNPVLGCKPYGQPVPSARPVDMSSSVSGRGSLQRSNLPKMTHTIPGRPILADRDSGTLRSMVARSGKARNATLESDARINLLLAFSRRLTLSRRSSKECMGTGSATRTLHPHPPG